jgi:hypothetical protein
MDNDHSGSPTGDQRLMLEYIARAIRNVARQHWETGIEHMLIMLADEISLEMPDRSEPKQSPPKP